MNYTFTVKVEVKSQRSGAWKAWHSAACEGQQKRGLQRQRVAPVSIHVVILFLLLAGFIRSRYTRRVSCGVEYVFLTDKLTQKILHDYL